MKKFDDFSKYYTEEMMSWYKKYFKIFIWIILTFCSYFLVVFINLNNEDIYNWEFETIINEGGIWNIIAFILFHLWWVTFTVLLIRKTLQLVKKILR